jgi:hypothetical protein
MPDEPNERKIPGFYVDESLYKSTAQAALDSDMSMSEFMRQLLLSSPAVQEGAIKAGKDISHITPKQRGGYRPRKAKQESTIDRPATTKMPPRQKIGDNETTIHRFGGLIAYGLRDRDSPRCRRTMATGKTMPVRTPSTYRRIAA